ncbi:hypothetical protein HKX48_001874 [Thoreauomyces humboldtii]|nr:hypothetical protein HKX48_001874 [Thoreauomyces humboldtii]
MPATYLRINITAHRAGSLPGYDGDRRVEWSIAEDAQSLAEAQRRTRDALRVLRAFWEDAAPEGLRFREFANTVLADGKGNSPVSVRKLNDLHNAATAARKLKEQQQQQQQQQADESAAAAPAHPDVAPAAEESAKSDEAATDAPKPASPAAAARQSSEEQPVDVLVHLLDPLAEKLVRHPNVLPAFLSDLRDWDSFRLLLRRHGGDVPFVTAAKEESLQASSRSESTALEGVAEGVDPTSASALTPTTPLQQQSLAATTVLLSALRTREHLWQEERSSLHAALWAAGEQVRTLVSTLTETLEKVAILTEGSSPATASRKSVRWDELVLKREVIRETATTWGLDGADGNILEWREAEWLKELARQEDLVRASQNSSPPLAANNATLAQSPSVSGSSNGSFSFSPEDILAVVRATRRLAARSPEGTGVNVDKEAYTSGSEDDDTEEDTDDEDELEDPKERSGIVPSVVGNSTEASAVAMTSQHREEDTDSDEDGDATMLAARLERLRGLADLAVANSAAAGFASPSSPQGTTLAAIQEASIESARGGRDDHRSESGSIGSAVLIASGRRRRPERSLSVDTARPSPPAAAGAAVPQTEEPTAAAATPAEAPVSPVSAAPEAKPMVSAATVSEPEATEMFAVKVPTTPAVEPTPPSTPPQSRPRGDSLPSQQTTSSSVTTPEPTVPPSEPVKDDPSPVIADPPRTDSKTAGIPRPPTPPASTRLPRKPTAVQRVWKKVSSEFRRQR